MQFIDEVTKEKLRGGFYTPEPLAKFLSEWAAESASSVLEPSCGDGEFLRVLKNIVPKSVVVDAVEIDPEEASKAAKIVAYNPNWHVYCKDFLKFEVNHEYDAVVGNPPYIRYQYLSNQAQEAAQKIYNNNSLKFTKHTNAWAPFIIRSINFLKPGGRIAMVVPAEIMNVIHAGAVREFILKECSKVLIIDTQDLMFAGALQRTVMLVAEKKEVQDKTSLCGLAFIKLDYNEFSIDKLKDHFKKSLFKKRAPSSEKWMASLLKTDEEKILEELLTHSQIAPFSDIAKVQVGIVTGANKFFLIDFATVQRYELEEFVKPMFGRSSHVQGIRFTTKDHQRNAAEGKPSYFLDLSDYSWGDLPAGVRNYIKFGESQNLHTRYKTRIREPWWAVPSVYATECGLLKRSHVVPKIIVNNAGAYTTDTAYRITTKIDPNILAVSWLNSLTLLYCELLGRSYGGGVLELVPSEIRKVPLPMVNFDGSYINEIDDLIRTGASIEDILKTQNKIIANKLNIDVSKLQILESARLRLLSRRNRK